MLMQILGWAIGIPVALLGLAYAAIFTAMLAAKFRQAQADFEAGSSTYAAAGDLRPRVAVDTRARQ
jgi:hypothetical protein